MPDGKLNSHPGPMLYQLVPELAEATVGHCTRMKDTNVQVCS